MSSLLHTVSLRWKDNTTLCALVPWSRVFTGRIPQTEMIPFPYVSILATGGRFASRTDKTRLSHATLSFHVWANGDELEAAINLATDSITDAFAETCWKLSDAARVIDVMDEGEPTARQTTLAGVKAWEVIKLFTVVIERDRVADETCCGVDEYSSETLGEDPPSVESSSSS